MMPLQRACGAENQVNELTVEEIRKLKPERIILSPESIMTPDGKTMLDNFIRD